MSNGSWALAEELYARGDEAFVDEIRSIHQGSRQTLSCGPTMSPARIAFDRPGNAAATARSDAAFCAPYSSSSVCQVRLVSSMPPADAAAFRRNDEKKLAPIIVASGAKVN